MLYARTLVSPFSCRFFFKNRKRRRARLKGVNPTLRRLQRFSRGHAEHAHICPDIEKRHSRLEHFQNEFQLWPFESQPRPNIERHRALRHQPE
jgi:hypothetical protein